ncbi:MAG: FAD:protein FMN transferase [Chloroflexi bacterium HGW-Chloroflexi-6]|nr:MAG: FAD:protein FMN transferase [Chloroflexi bacterium HGW-Chloroflexi-6]
MLVAIDSPQKPAELDLVPTWFEAWEQTFSRFRLDSELSLVNRRAGIPTQVSREFADVFEIALEVERISGGMVTPVLLDNLLRSGYDRSFDLLAPQQVFSCPEPILSLPRLSEIDWNVATRTICSPPDLHLDFGGIVKGWAAHQAAEKLKEFGPTLVDAGGDIAVSGLQADGQPWPIGVANPFNPTENLDLLQIEAGGVATSGRDRRRWLQGSRWNHHIIDPRSGAPAETDVLTATVIAPSVIQAEMTAKTCLILGSQNGLDWLETDPSLAGMLVLEDGQRLYSNKFENYLWR